MTIQFPFQYLQPSYFSISQNKRAQNFVTPNSVCCFTIIVVIKTCLFAARRQLLSLYVWFAYTYGCAAKCCN